MVIKISPGKSEEDLKIFLQKLDKEISNDLEKAKRKHSGKCDIDGAISDLRNISRKIGAAEAVLDMMAYRGRGTDFGLSHREVVQEKDKQLTELIRKISSECEFGGRVYRERGGKARIVYDEYKGKRK
jgi:hypothetical protein